MPDAQAGDELVASKSVFGMGRRYGIGSRLIKQPNKRVRLDLALVDRGSVSSRETARRLVMAGQVRVNGQPARKPSQTVSDADKIEVVAPPRYVSRGGFKLEHALREFGLDVTGAVALDIGASTGGFTDCLLQHGAARVYAVDVGRGQLSEKLRRDPRVIAIEGVNARRLRFSDIGEQVDLITADVSFISLTIVLPPAYGLLSQSGKLVALIKPQFEAGRAQVGRGGVVRRESVRVEVVDRIRRFAVDALGGTVVGVTRSPIVGPAGNIEYLICIRKP